MVDAPVFNGLQVMVIAAITLFLTIQDLDFGWFHHSFMHQFSLQPIKIDSKVRQSPVPPG